MSSPSSDPNGNGTSFNTSGSNPYYTITAINGDILTVSAAALNAEGQTR